MKTIIKRIIYPFWLSSFGNKIRGLYFILKEKLTNYSNERKRFKEKTGYDLDLKNPQSFNQKLVWKRKFMIV